MLRVLRVLRVLIWVEGNHVTCIVFSMARRGNSDFACLTLEFITINTT
jgi:hypothetical protein